MSSSVVALRGCQRPSLLSLPSERRGSTGPAATSLARRGGLALDDWQAWCLDEGLSERDDGKWSAFEVGIIVGRQNGKGSILEARQLAGLTFLHERLQVHTAHEFKTCYEHFLRLVQLVEADPEIDRKVMRVRRGAGEQAIEMRGGERLRFLARSGGSGRGMSGDVVYIDEAFAMTPPMMGALLPTLSARANPQVWYTSSAPLASSVVLHGLRARASAGGGERLFYAEWGNDEGVDPEDMDALARANPALGIRISIDSVLAERDAMPPNEFARERMGVPDPLPDDAAHRPAKIDADQWARTLAPAQADVSSVVLGVDVAPDGEWSSVAVGAGSLASPYVEVIEHRQGTGWVPEFVVKFIQARSPSAVGIDVGGPAGAVLGALLAELRAAEISSDVVRPMSTAEMKQACAAFHADVVEGRLRHPDGQGPLDVAVSDAVERRVGDGWLWDRRSATVPISPLVAATIARSLLLVDAEPASSFAIVL